MTGLDRLFKTRCEYVPVRLPSAIPADDSLKKPIQTCFRLSALIYASPRI